MARSAGRRALRALYVAALAVACCSAASRCFLPTSTRASSRVVARASFETGKVNVGVDAGVAPPKSVPAPLLEVNAATSVAILDCLEEGCSVEALMALDAKLARDELKVKGSLDEIQEVQKTEFSEDNTEAIAWFENFLGRTGTLRAQLQAMKGVEDTDFVKQLMKAASVAFGGGRPNDYPKIGVSPYSA
mmetsp:Transcript_23359/g.47279  ORF Transcript_23359/g.47279 Transcript_23359/m.47279 type:complete len:190 (-) Transcript_23359:159-728(-)